MIKKSLCRNFADMVLMKTLFYTDTHCQIRITQGKGSKDRQVSFPRFFHELLALHIEKMRTKGVIYLFESIRKHKYTDRGVRKMPARYARAAGITRSIRQSLEMYSGLSLADAQPSYKQAMERFPIQ
jgi:integrase/recombinase XerD